MFDYKIYNSNSQYNNQFGALNFDTANYAGLYSSSWPSSLKTNFPAQDFDGVQHSFTITHTDLGYYFSKVSLITPKRWIWTKHIPCSRCTSGSFFALISSDRTIAYSTSVFTDGATTYNMFMALYWSSGEVLAPRYYHNFEDTKQSSIHEQGDYIYVIFMTTSQNLIGEMYKSNMTIHNTYQTAVNYNRFAFGTTGSRLIIVGEYNSE